MFKKTTPVSTTSSVKINGETKSKTSVNANGSSSTNYYMSPNEQYAYKYAQDQFASGLKGINVFSPETLKELSDSVEAYKNKGIQQINDIYNPMLYNLQNNIASRFGNLDNSIFLDKLHQIEGSRAQSISALAQDVTSREQQLKQNELASRYDYLNFLNNYQNQVYKNAAGISGNDQTPYQKDNSNLNAYSNQLSSAVMSLITHILNN